VSPQPSHGTYQIKSTDEPDEPLFGESGKGSDHGFNISTGVKLIHSAYGGDNPLGNLLSLPAVLDKLEVLIITTYLALRSFRFRFSKSASMFIIT
jgi:hypothetical protein